MRLRRWQKVLRHFVQECTQKTIASMNDILPNVNTNTSREIHFVSFGLFVLFLLSLLIIMTSFGVGKFQIKDIQKKEKKNHVNSEINRIEWLCEK